MTTQRYHRCKHCGNEYIYQGSGEGTSDYNHQDWCHDCYKAVSDALKARPRLFEGRYQDIKEAPRFASITPDIVEGWDIENAAELAARDRGPKDERGFRRVYSPLFDMKGDSTNTKEVVGRGVFQGIKFLVMRWRNSDRHESTTTWMEYDLQKKCFTGHQWPRDQYPRPSGLNTDPLHGNVLPTFDKNDVTK